MRLDVQSTVSLAFLSIVNMCLCLQDLAEKTLGTLSTELLQQAAARYQLGDHRPLATAENFMLVDQLADGELERRISYDGLTAKGTSIGNSTKSLHLWQLTNGNAFIQMIYSADDELIDCEYQRQKPLVRDFLTKFHSEVATARARNFTAPPAHRQRHHPRRTPSAELSQTLRDFHAITGVEVPDTTPADADVSADDAFGMRTLQYVRLSGKHDIPADLRPLMQYGALKQQCDQRHAQLKRIVHDMQSDESERREAATESLQRKKRALSDWLLAPNTKWCGRGQSATSYNQLGGATKTDKCCRRHDLCRNNIHALTTKWQLFNYRPFTISHCKCDMSHRRDLGSLMRVPGTKWCGKGYSATRYTEMGGRSRADRCCRQHDLACPFWIAGFQQKYGTFNWRVNTLMHCKCDERFRTCLKMAGSADATMVGKLFFNIVQTKCFVLKPEKTCKRYTWWGGQCEKYVTRKRAHLRDNRKF